MLPSPFAFSGIVGGGSFRRRESLLRRTSFGTHLQVMALRRERRLRSYVGLCSSREPDEA